MFIKQGSHPHLSTLTRQANRIRCGRRYSQCHWKQWNYTINYEQGDGGLAKKLGVSVEEARARKRIYFDQYPEVEKFIEATHQRCRSMLEVLTILGRKRRLLDSDADWYDAYFSRKTGKWVPEHPGPLAARALRQSVNSRIQGSAADVARMAQIRCEEDHILAGLGVRQLLQIHDEVLFEVPTKYLKEGCTRIQELMEKPFLDIPERLGLNFRELPVPLDVDIGYGESWSEAH